MRLNKLPTYAELHCISNFTFLRGASHPEELVTQAEKLCYDAIAITDECSLAGVVRAHVAAKAGRIKLIIGSEFRLQDHLHLVVLATNREGYANLAELITKGRRAAEKGAYTLIKKDFESSLHGCLILLIPQLQQLTEHTLWLKCNFPNRAWIAVELLGAANDRAKLEQITEVSKSLGVPMVAAGNVHMHVRKRLVLQHTLTAIRLGTRVDEAGSALLPNSEAHLRPRQTLQRIYTQKMLQASVNIANRCDFSLDSLHYEYPEEIVPAQTTPTTYLRQLTQSGLQTRWPNGIPEKVRTLVEHELELIAQLHYEAYFLTVYDIVKFARRQGILCQGRGSAANSAVCYCLGITEVDPDRMSTLFERFISKERNEPPDIDVDFEHNRREEVIQYIYTKYGRNRAALAATVVTYQARSAIRDIGKALGMNLDQVDQLAKSMAWWDGRKVLPQRLHECGFEPQSPLINRLIELINTVVGFPRHLSQHVGGFIISRGPLSSLVPIENASMPDRTVIQWDKDDLDSLGLLKVDCLALGMLTAIHQALDLIGTLRNKAFGLADVPAEDPAVYKMIQRAETVGVFQIESRAQMSMLPRLKPKNYYDLVIEVAIIRPGPIQGGMIHPYLRRRNGIEPVSYPSDAVKSVLQRTLGVPIFQEQVMQLAIVAAGFSAGEADQLRRGMAAWKRKGGLEQFEQRLIQGMQQRGYPRAFAQQIFQQILGFGEYGFPESHAASFALLAYVSAWLKCHEPAAFTCALLNSQPMGFYAPAQLVQECKRQGVEVRPADVTKSDWNCLLEATPGMLGAQPALRLGLRLVKGLSFAGAQRLVAARRDSPFKDVQELAYHARLDRRDMAALSAADTLRALAGNRHQASWKVLGIEEPMPVFDNQTTPEIDPTLRTPTEVENLIADYESLGLTLGRHPLAMIRKTLDKKYMQTATDLNSVAHKTFTQVTGIVINRQRPATASGVLFLTLEDETGFINVVVWRSVVEKYRKALLQARLLSIYGILEREGDVLNLIARRVVNQTRLLGDLALQSRDFH